MNAFQILLREGGRSWLRPRGLWIVLLAALVPPLLTSTWVGTHQDDLVPTLLTYEPMRPGHGQLVNITAEVRNDWDHAVGPFNVTLEVGYFEVARGTTQFRTLKSNTTQMAGLGAHGSAAVAMNWTASAGTVVFQVRVDSGDALREMEENNNHRFEQVQVDFPPPPTPPPSSAPSNETLPGIVDLAVGNATWQPDPVHTGDSVNVTIPVENRGNQTVANATVRFQVYQASAFGYGIAPVFESESVVTLSGRETRDLTFQWSPAQIARYALAGMVEPPANHTDPHPGDDFRYRETFVDRRFVYEPPAEKETAKAFYRDVLVILHLKLLIPLIALFYAAGVLEEERERGNLTYLLTRPVARWVLPVSRFALTVTVAGAAVAVGVFATYWVLLGAGYQPSGFLVGPLLISLVAVFLYAGAFTWLGMAARRPYYWGLTYVLGLETAILLGRGVLVNGQPLLQDWVTRLSLNEWIIDLFDAWDPHTGLDLSGAARTLGVLLLIGLGAVAAAAVTARKREYDA